MRQQTAGILDSLLVKCDGFDGVDDYDDTVVGDCGAWNTPVKCAEHRTFLTLLF
jgi:hypothetical protein